MAINKTYTSNTLYNDSTGVIAFAEQLKQELINWANYHHVTEELGPDNRPDTQNALNNLFLSVYERFLTFLNDADATEEAINTWKEIENFLADYTDEKTLAEIVSELNDNIESRLTVPLESTTGSSTTSTMTQKAITDSINSSTTFTTSESVDNIGIDAEPTAGSDNLVKSGGVQSQISQLDQKVDEIQGNRLIKNSDFTVGYSLTSDGYLALNQPSYRALYKETLTTRAVPILLAVNPGDKVYYTGYVRGTAVAVMGYRSNDYTDTYGVLLGDPAETGTDYTNEEVIIPDGVTYISISGRIEQSSTEPRETNAIISGEPVYANREDFEDLEESVNGISGRVTSLEEDVADIEDRVEGLEDNEYITAVNINTDGFTTGYVLSSDGDITTSSVCRALYGGWVTSRGYPTLIEVPEGAVVKYTGFAKGSIMAVMGYRSNDYRDVYGILLQGNSDGIDYVDEVVNIPSGVKYISASGRIINNSNVAKDTILTISMPIDRVVEELEDKVSNYVFNNFYPVVLSGKAASVSDGTISAVTGRTVATFSLAGKNIHQIKAIATPFDSGDTTCGCGFIMNDGSWKVIPNSSTIETVIVDIPFGAKEFRWTWKHGQVPLEDQVFAASIPYSEDSKPLVKIRSNFDIDSVPSVSYIADSNDLDALYDLYDGLVTDYPDYVSKVDCSDADAVLGITRPSELSGLPIYMYQFKNTFTRRDTHLNAGKRRQKVFIVTGVHSNEKMGIHSTYSLMKMLCENWSTVEEFETLRTMVDFYIIPCVNPWGYVHTDETIPGITVPGRNNYNNVNLNRNFPSDNWSNEGYGTSSVDSPDGNYAGSSAGSEYETKIVCYYASLIKPTVFLDIHTMNMDNYGTFGATNCVYSDGCLATALSVSKSMTSCLIKQSNDFPNNPNVNLYNIDSNPSVWNAGSTFLWAHENITKDSYLLEKCVNSNWANGVLTEQTQIARTDNIYRWNIQFLLDYLLTILASPQE